MKTRDSARRRAIASALTLLFLIPLLALPLGSAYASPQFGTRQQTAQRQGMSTKKKVVLLAGAALVYYLYRKHQAKKAEEERRPAAAVGRTPTGTRTNASNRMPQLYRSKNGGVYYRDASGKPVWLTAPSRSIQVPADDLRRYAPDYTRYRGPAPRIPSGARTESFEDFNSDLFTGTNYGGGSRSTSGGGSMPPGPRGF